ncbi:MAG: hypothetical protein CMJ78_27345 [Planctomycetaceae bacterium]|nr:hypothetical protein [Planctomycetaceae bacterium]
MRFSDWDESPINDFRFDEPEEFLSPSTQQADIESNDPTPTEIRRACLEIQTTWSEAERRFRAGLRRGWEVETAKLQLQ